MDLRQLRTFTCLAETGSLSKTSDRLDIAQPALSRQIRLLESYIGAPLFHRHSRGMQITDTGKELLERVSGLIRQLDRAVEEARELGSTSAGTVSIGLVPSVSGILAGRLARRVAVELPSVTFRIVEGYVRHLVEWLHRGDVNAAITYGPGANIHCQVFDLLVEDMFLVGDKDSDLDPKRPVPFASLANRHLVLPSRPHGLRAVVDDAAARAGITLKVRVEADTFLVLKDFVVGQLGFTILPASALVRETHEGLLKIAPLVDPGVTRQLVIATPLGTAVNRATQAVLDIVKEEICALIRSGAWNAYPMGDLLRIMNMNRPASRKEAGPAGGSRRPQTVEP
jgi:DNA-binding transcriptional LysR family regulator